MSLRPCPWDHLHPNSSLFEKGDLCPRGCCYPVGPPFCPRPFPFAHRPLTLVFTPSGTSQKWLLWRNPDLMPHMFSVGPESHAKRSGPPKCMLRTLLGEIQNETCWAHLSIHPSIPSPTPPSPLLCYAVHLNGR